MVWRRERGTVHGPLGTRLPQQVRAHGLDIPLCNTTGGKVALEGAIAPQHAIDHKTHALCQATQVKEGRGDAPERIRALMSAVE